MAEHHFVTLGAFKFKSTSVEVGAVEKEVKTVASPFSGGPFQAFSFVKGFRSVRIEGFFLCSTSAELLVQKGLLEAEISKSSNSLVIDWMGGGRQVFSVYQTEEGPSYTYFTHAQRSKMVNFSVSLSCL
jgi:hypothetical protein